MTKEQNAPDPLVEGLMDRRTVVLGGDITDKSIGLVAKRLMLLQMRSSDRINLAIDSSGGDINAALSLCDVITTILTAPVRGIAIGECGSAATFIMLHCKERISTPYSRFLIHSGTRQNISTPINQTSTVNLEQLLKEVRSYEEMVLKLYMSRLTPLAWDKSFPTVEERRAFVQNLINRGDQRFDDWMSAPEALEIGLIEKIVGSNLGIFDA